MGHLTYERCRLCPRQCGVNRAAGQLGFCRQGATLRAARAGLHFWEEPVISGSFGSGAVFFSGCTLGCVYCQNQEISHEGLGKDLTPQRLREIFEDLIDQGAETIDLVTPTHFLPSILPALTPKLPVPVVYNCGGYESVETLRALEGLVDIYLPDLKYSSGPLAGQLSQAPDYPQVAGAAILEMFRQVGRPQYQGEMLKRGVVLRHLLLPGYLDNTLGVLDWVDHHFQPGDLLVSLMRQYIPMGQAASFGSLGRTVTDEEYDAALSYMMLLDIQGFTQDSSASVTEYVPRWDFSGL